MTNRKFPPNQTLDSSSSESKLVGDPTYSIIANGTRLFSGLTMGGVVQYTCFLLGEPGIDPDSIKAFREN